MPHIASQIRQREAVPPSPSLRRAYECHDFDRPEMYQRQKASSNSEHQLPSLSLLVSMPDAKHHDFSSASDRHGISSPNEHATPNTSVESVFDLPSAYPTDSPNSSIGSRNSSFGSPSSSTGSSNTSNESPCSLYNSPKSSQASSFIVELEDTSALAASKLSTPAVPTEKRQPLPDFKRVPIEPLVEASYLDQLRKTEISVSAFAAASIHIYRPIPFSPGHLEIS